MANTSELTRNQSLVLGALAQAECPLSAYSLLARLEQDGLRAPLQVYRALEKLIERGLVHRIESLNAFVACEHPHENAGELIAFAICDKCGHVTEFPDGVVQRRLKRWSKAHAFRSDSITLEMRGICENCLET